MNRKNRNSIGIGDIIKLRNSRFHEDLIEATNFEDSWDDKYLTEDRFKHVYLRSNQKDTQPYSIGTAATTLFGATESVITDIDKTEAGFVSIVHTQLFTIDYPLALEMGEVSIRSHGFAVYSEPTVEKNLVQSLEKAENRYLEQLVSSTEKGKHNKQLYQKAFRQLLIAQKWQIEKWKYQAGGIWAIIAFFKYYWDGANKSPKADMTGYKQLFLMLSQPYKHEYVIQMKNNIESYLADWNNIMRYLHPESLRDCSINEAQSFCQRTFLNVLNNVIEQYGDVSKDP